MQNCTQGITRNEAAINGPVALRSRGLAAPGTDTSRPLRIGLPWGAPESLLCAALIREALCILEGRWKIEIMACLSMTPVMRFSELRKALAPVSQKVLSSQLRELERDGIIHRTAYATVPIQVDYTLTDRGAQLGRALTEIFRWGVTNLADGYAS